MSNIVVLKREQFDKILDALKELNIKNRDLIYEIYTTASEGMDELIESNILPSVGMVNPVDIIYYCVGEYLYTASNKSEEDQKALLENEDYITSCASVVSDKYLSLAKFGHNERKLANKYIPPISTINLYLNFMLNILHTYKKNDPKSTLINDLLIKSVSISRCILQLITDGYETEAFSSWRTLHECECTLLLLDKYGDPLINRYLIHMQYGLVFRRGETDDEHANKIFADMKEEMKQYGLKSKDIKKYIEYGWLYSIPGVKEDPNFKLNFRDGLEKYAGLSSYSARYESSSEIIHSTPILIYSNKEYYYFISLLSLYESFFRLEKVFVSLFAKQVSEEQMKQYLEIRKLYYAQLVNIHKRESMQFQRWHEAQQKKQGQ